MNIQEIIKTTYNETHQKEIARVLKNKRLDKGLSLEEVAEGICSVSHLSRMENNLVKLQDSYLKLLFDKLDINYEILKESRQKNLFVEILKKHLLKQEKQYEEAINEIVSSKHFTNVEQEMILLFDKISKNEMEEAEILLEHIEKTNSLLLEEERAFYLYLLNLYYYKTDQINMAYRHIKLLENCDVDDEIMYWLNFELAMKLYFHVGQYTKYTLMYTKFIKDSPGIYFSSRFREHLYKIIYLESVDDYNTAIGKMQELYQEIDVEKKDVLEEYFYHLGLIMIKNNRYQAFLKFIDQNVLSTRVVKLLSISLMNIENNELYLDKVEMLNNYGFNKYETSVKTLAEYANLKFNGGSIIRMTTLLKNKIFNNLKNSFDYIIYLNIIKEIVIFNSKYGKYKDACILIQSVLKRLDNQLLAG